MFARGGNLLANDVLGTAQFLQTGRRTQLSHVEMVTQVGADSDAVLTDFLYLRPSQRRLAEKNLEFRHDSEDRPDRAPMWSHTPPLQNQRRGELDTRSRIHRRTRHRRLSRK